MSGEKFSWLFEQPFDINVGILQKHLSICQLVVNQILEEDAKFLSVARCIYSLKFDQTVAKKF